MPTWWVVCNLSHVYSLWILWKGVWLLHALVFHMPKPVSLLVWFFNILQCCLVSYFIKNNCLHKIKKKVWPVAYQKNLHSDFLFKYPIGIFLSIMWKSLANIVWSLKKSCSFLAALLHNSIINFIYETICIDLVKCV